MSRIASFLYYICTCFFTCYFKLYNQIEILLDYASFDCF